METLAKDMGKLCSGNRIGQQGAEGTSPTFLTIIGSDANRVFETFEWTNESHKSDIAQVLDKFEA